ncbi:retropepsin-like aspartic protease [Flavobacterium sp.]|uniref:retropepsin-like aspartic protease n=1 Tax=Flavobacterium sp. TaxID=239 RepID=UPI00391D1664
MKSNVKLNSLLVLLFLTVHLCAQELSFDQGNIKGKNYYEEIDFEIVNDKIIIPVTINDKTYKFLLDTGAPNLITKRLKDEISIQSLKRIPVSDANNQVDTLEMIAVKSIKLKNLNFENNVVLATDLDHHFILKCYKIDGFIGSNLFKKSILKISLKDKKIIITDDIKKLHPKSKPTKLTLFGDQKSPYIKINLTGNNQEKGYEDVLVDTGMDGFYEISNRAYSVFSKENIFEELSKSKGTSNIGLFGAAPVKEQILVKPSKLQINDTTFENLITNTTDDNNSRLGLDILKYGDIIIDFKNKKFYFESEKLINLDHKAPIYSPTVLEQKFVIGHVWDKNYQDRLKFGDEIIRIDNHILSEMDFCDIIKLKKNRDPKKDYELEVRTNDNQTTTIKIEHK